MIWRKRIALVAVVLGAVAAVYRFAYLPWRCNVEAQRLRARTEITLGESQIRQSQRARQTVDDVLDLPGHCQSDAKIEMILAVNYRMLGRFDDAIAAYQRALETEKRPEIYLQLGLTQLAAHQNDAALENLRTAVRFHPPLMHELPDSMRRQLAGSAGHS